MQWTLIDDPDIVMRAGESYFASLTPEDLSARRAHAISEYTDRYRQALLVSLNPRVSATLSRAVTLAATALAPFKRISSIPWRIAVLSAKTAVEDGFPHTHGDIIVMTERSIAPYVTTARDFDDDDDLATLAELLVHEKVHVYQRMFPTETRRLITEWWRCESLPASVRMERARSNPDIGSTRYAIAGRTWYQRYSSDRPRNLSDSSVHVVPLPPSLHSSDDPIHIQQTLLNYEHPNEAMAYMIASELFPDDIGDDELTLAHKRLVEWMAEWL